MTPTDIVLEIKRRQRAVYRRSLYFLVPFVLELIAAAVHAPRVWAAAGFVAIVAGWINLGGLFLSPEPLPRLQPAAALPVSNSDALPALSKLPYVL